MDLSTFKTLTATTIPINQLVANHRISSSEAKVFQRLMGLSQVARDENSNHDLFLNALILNMLDEFPIPTDKVKYILLAHTADYISPMSVNILNYIIKKYNFTHAKYFSTSIYKCAGIFYLIHLSNALIKTIENDEYILLLTVDFAFTPILQSIPGSTVLGDSASLVLLSKMKSDHKIIDIIYDVDERFSMGVNESKENNLLFQSIYIQKLSSIIKKIIIKNSLNLFQIKIIFPHNVNTLSWKQVAKFLSISVDKIFLENVPRYAHCFGSDPWINLQTGLMKGLVKPGDYYLLVTVGLGATFSVVLMYSHPLRQSEPRT
ncbi:MAG: hypothetical protein ACD_70C00221G0006 [uncultured bacterium]|nr:MAG: hypothetical protein ACD_70C00221G0006 [uncultured bacterium]